MNVKELKAVLANNPDKTVRFVLPTGSKVAPHAHVTEVARIDKRFIDCGGTKRTDAVCRLQTWMDDDTDHRLTAGKLAGILTKAAPLLESEALDVDVEHEAPFISQFPIETVDVDAESVTFRLGIKHTDCLAKDKCSPPAKSSLRFSKLPALQPAKCCS
jgi:hypothetical protein